ncbi:hypothetical protein AS156_27800 [Bradyrhizobium macuxiense]|uniref:Uncharacterized protein n=1 Tax=Bradyrhizobium macuxiense TaxID=1755647 RepID=A0A109K4X7_9BRAD|nr:hypothetical protein AS156_27800 [Bradyrhizobium macuxiense]
MIGCFFWIIKHSEVMLRLSGHHCADDVEGGLIGLLFCNSLVKVALELIQARAELDYKIVGQNITPIID